MCGVFYIYDPALSGTDLRRTHYKTAVSGLSDRGPDGAHDKLFEHAYALHCLLSITGSKRQPVSWNKGTFLFNGEIYNDWRKYSVGYGDADFLERGLNEAGTGLLPDLDGEFALIVINEESKKLHLASDTFGTKPFYYAFDGRRIACASYDFILRKCGFANPIRVPANQAITICLSKAEVIEETELRPFDFNTATCSSYQPFADAFQLAVKKRAARVQRGIYVPLSSGHDSGLIAAELEALGISFTAYGFPFMEVEEVFDERFVRLKEKGLQNEVLKPSQDELEAVRRELHDGIPAFRLTTDVSKPGLYADDDVRNVTGFISAAYIAKLARSKGELIALSGQGADEIISDYFNPFSNSRRSCLRGEWGKATGPWENFYGGWNRLFLEGNERVYGHYGIETRYPFLDHAVIQAFLNLTPEMKGKRYKGCIAYRMDQLDYPYHDRKLGFAGYSRESLDQRVARG